MLLSLQPPAPTLILRLGQVILLLGNLPGDVVLHLLNLIVHHHLIINQQPLPTLLSPLASVAPKDVKILKERFFWDTLYKIVLRLWICHLFRSPTAKGKDGRAVFKHNNTDQGFKRTMIIVGFLICYFLDFLVSWLIGFLILNVVGFFDFPDGSAQTQQHAEPLQCSKFFLHLNLNTVMSPLLCFVVSM